MKFYQPIAGLCLAVIVSLTACGGGGGDSTTSVPTASTTTFPLQSARDAMRSATRSLRFSMTVNGNGSSATGSGTITYGAVVDTIYQGSAARSSTNTIIGTGVENGATTSLAESTTTYYNLNGDVIGDSGGEYTFITSTTPYPTTVKVNDTGVRSIGNRYTSFTNRTLLGTVTRTWVVDGETESTAIFTEIVTEKDNYDKTTGKVLYVHRITKSGDMKLLYFTIDKNGFFMKWNVQ